MVKGELDAVRIASRSKRKALPHKVAAPTSVGAGGDGTGGAVEKAVADAAGAGVRVRSFGYLKEFLAEFAEVDIERLFLAVLTHAEVQDIARFLLAHPAFGTPRDIACVPTKNFAADLQSGFCRRAVRIHGSNDPRSAGLALCKKTESGADCFMGAEFKAGADEKIGVRQRLSASNIIVKKLSERAASELLSFKADV
jgi:hypothetical protein